MKINKLYEVLSKYIMDLDNMILLKWLGKYGCEITRVQINSIEYENIFLALYMYSDYGSPIPFFVSRENLRKFLKGEPMEDGTYLYGKGLSKVQELLEVEEQDLYDLKILHSKEEKRVIGQMASSRVELRKLAESLKGIVDLTDKLIQLEEKLQEEMNKYSGLLNKECIYNSSFSGKKRCIITKLSHFTDQGYLVVRVEYPENKGFDCACLYNLILE